ncbi:MAG: F420-non-reducing hydrogenase iron-sulfur subunit [Thermoproteota archaeon]|nr:F420-non-reducing hydrogenase iron-sulfur subunit [Thermoproteota archaeon]
MCSGRIDPDFILETLIHGADGVLVMGCHPGDCHYIEGNLHAERKAKMLRNLIAETGLEPERMHLEWVSASEGARFAQLVKEFTDRITKLGPSPISGENPNKVILENLLAAKRTAGDFRLRVIVGRERELVEDKNAYGEKVPQEKLDELLSEAIKTEYTRNRIYNMLEKESLSVRELSKRLDLSTQDVLTNIVVMRKKGMLGVERIEGTTPIYMSLEVR